MAEVSELACTYAALILADDNVPVTADKINNILKAAGVEVEAYWPGLFARVLKDKKVEDLVANVGGAAPAATGAVAPAQAAASDKKEDKKEDKKKKEEPKEEEDEDMGLGLFD
eukprot:TRINITY_DN56828_c0_g1_i1.p1 TRINITY_DN56828_c0_g1~~TRINITY_DN56828_c0_g1_i1.p1  ORF type:complete len:113 (-),score=91.20 TRINITY_DN56828_c0_g1_i1:46-384(-)